MLIHDHDGRAAQHDRVVVAGLQPRLGRRGPARARRPLAGLILVTAFDLDPGHRHAALPSPRALAPAPPFRSDAALAGLDMPVAVIAAEQDDIVPPDHTRRLIDELAQPVLVAWIKDADHVSIYDHIAYREAFIQALDRLLAHVPAPVTSRL